MNEVVKIQDYVKPDNMSTDECLEYMAQYGEPRLRKFDNGWYSSIDVFVTGEGVKFEVKTGFNEPTPQSAANKCLALLIKAIQDVKDSA